MVLSTFRNRFLASCPATAAAIAFGLAVPAYAQEQTYEVDIEAQDLASALREFAIETRQQVAFDDAAVRGKRSPTVRGSYTAQRVLDRLLANSGLEARRGASGIFVVSKSNSDPDISIISSKTSDNEESDNQIIVTGTFIRGIAPESSPNRVYTRTDIERSGAATAQEFISTLPANFGGGSNAGVPGGLANDTAAGANAGGFGSYGSSVNLRGLGSGSTLVLLNGNRVAPSSIIGDFVDISMIPATAIERIETLTDGASSIYGSDAVAGVVNFILRDDFRGFEGSLRYGTGTEGGAPDQVRASITGGSNWGTGSALAVFEHFDQKALSVESRDFARNDFAPSFLLPSQRRNSILGNLRQSIANIFDVSVTGLYSHRDSSQLRTDITRNSFRYDAETETLNLSGHAFAPIGSGWHIDWLGQYGTVETSNRTNGNLITSGPFEVTRDSNSQVWSTDARVSGPTLNLPAGSLKIALGAHYRNEDFQSSGVTINPVPQFAKRDVYALYGETFIPIIANENNFPFIKRLELNISGRFENYSDFGNTFDPKFGILYSPAGSLNIRASYSTSFKAPALGLVGAQDFGASLLPTSLLFSIFQLTPADPSLADVVQLTVSGTDNNLKPETSKAFTAGFDFQKEWGKNSITASATWFDINFENRLGNIPIPGNVIHFDAINIAFENPNVFPSGSFTFNPSRDEISGVLNSLETPLGNPFGLDPFDTFFISRVLIVTNTSRSIARGLDFALGFTRNTDNGSLQFGLDGTYLRDFKRQATSTTPIVENIGTIFNPVDIRMRGTLSYSTNNLSGSAFLNFVNSYKTDNTPEAMRIDSWTTFDLNVTFDTKENLGGRLFRNTALRLSILNVFDQDPPALPLFRDIGVDGYDPTNASPLGRFVSLELIKRF